MDSSISTRQWHLALKSDSRFLPCTAGALESIAKAVADMQAQLVLVFGDVAYFSAEDPVAERLRAALALASPQTLVAGCSTAGEITRSGFHVGTLVVTALKLGSGSILLHSLPIETPEQSSAAGQAVSEVLSSKARESQGDLRHLWVLSPGVNVNGSALVEGLRAGFGPGPVPAISGGLAGDGGAFRQTYTLTPEGVSTRHLLGIGFVGDRLVSGSGAAGGWEPFGPSRRITRAHGNRLEVLDQEPALDVYRRYLGDYAKDLPASALLFPLQVATGPDQGLIRTILSIDEPTGALILAGDVHQGEFLRLMHASTQQLAGAAEQVGRDVVPQGQGETPSLTLLVSCVGRRIVMGDLTDEEVDAVCEQLPDQAMVAGFYSNGEIAAWKFHGDCRLHNQTMTITWIGERSSPTADSPR